MNELPAQEFFREWTETLDLIHTCTTKTSVIVSQPYQSFLAAIILQPLQLGEVVAVHP